MYKSEFDKLEKIPLYLLFYGDKFYLQEYESKLINKFKNENILKFYYDEYDFDTIKSYLSENSLFGEKNIIIIKHNKVPSNIEKLIKYAKDNYLFFFYYGDKKLDIFKKNFVRFFEPTLNEKIEFINELSKEYKVSLSKEAINFIVNSVEPLFYRKEIEKLSNYSNDINLEDVKKLVFIYKEESFEELFIKILNGEEFFDELNQILQTVDFKRILPALIRYIRELYEYNLYIKQTGEKSLQGFLGYKLPFKIENQRISLAIKFKDKDFLELLKTLLNYELKMRNTQKDKESIFNEAIIFLKTINSF